jgi:hypothetical protein
MGVRYWSGYRKRELCWTNNMGVRVRVVMALVFLLDYDGIMVRSLV